MASKFIPRQLAASLNGRSVAKMDTVDPAVGRRLMAARRAAGMQTRDELAEAAGLRRVGAATIGKIERGERPLEPHEAEAFARAMNIDTRTFYDDPEGTQLDRLEQAIADIARREDTASQEREGIRALLAQQSQILSDIGALLKKQDEILTELQRVAGGMPDDETLRRLDDGARLVNEGAQQLLDAAQAAQAGPDEQSAAQAGSRRRQAGG